MHLYCFFLKRYLWLDWWMVLLFNHLPCFSLTLILFAPRRDDMQFTPAHNEEISGSTYQNITKDSQDRIPCNHHGNWKTCLEGVSFILDLLRSLFQFRLSKISPSSFRTLHAAPQQGEDAKTFSRVGMRWGESPEMMCQFVPFFFLGMQGLKHKPLAP